VSPYRTLLAIAFAFVSACSIGIENESGSHESDAIDPVEVAFAPDGSSPELVALIKSQLLEPDSFRHVETIWNSKGYYGELTCRYYAETNAGHLELQSLTVTTDLTGKISIK